MSVRGKILLIDDDPLFLQVLGAAFIENGFAVVTAGDGVAGLKQYLSESPDVVISDLIMPRMGGPAPVWKFLAVPEIGNRLLSC